MTDWRETREGAGGGMDFETWFTSWKNPHGTSDAVEADRFAANAGWQAAMLAAAKICNDADKSMHPADLADAIQALVQTD